MNKVLDLVSKVVCFILCIVLFCAISCYLTLYSAINVVNRDNITAVVSSLDIKTIIGEEELNSIYDDNSLGENDRKIIEGILNSKDFKNVMGKYFSNVLELVLYNKEGEQITKEEIMDIFENNIDYISSQYGVMLTYEEKQEILKSVEAECDEIVNTLSNTEETINELNADDLRITRFLFGGSLQNILLVIIGVLVVLTALFRWSFYKFAIWTGVATLASGAFFAGLGEALKSLLHSQLTSEVTLTSLELLDKNVFGFITNTGIVVIIIGVVQILYYFILKKTNENVKI